MNTLSNLRHQALNSNDGHPLARLCKVIIHLHPKPGIRRTAESFFKPDRHFRCNVAASGHNIMKLLARNADAFSGFRDTQVKIVKALFGKFARMDRFFIFMVFSPPS